MSLKKRKSITSAAKLEAEAEIRSARRRLNAVLDKIARLENFLEVLAELSA